jgi:hypothetical protein
VCIFLLLPKLIVMCNMVHLSDNVLCVSFVPERGDCDLRHCVLQDSSVPKDGDRNLSCSVLVF